MRYLQSLFFLALLFSASTRVWTAEAPAIKPETVQAWMNFLASDDMKGRENGSPELEKAAWWLEKQFKELGLTPVPGQTSFFHEYTTADRAGGSLSGKNVIGWLEGSDPQLKNQYIMLSGHYDHIGIKEAADGGDSIYNGADDDASGVLTSLGIVQILKQLQKQPGFYGFKRSILIVAWSGEELGLLGSEAYAKAPWLPLKDMCVNLNFELTGHTEKLGTKKLWMVGTDFSELDELVAPIFKENGWEFTSDPFPDLKLFFRSDNVNFALMEFDRANKKATGIPAHSFSTWGGEDHYHAAFDEADRINYENMANLIQVMSKVVVFLANKEEMVQWSPGAAIEFSRPQ